MAGDEVHGNIKHKGIVAKYEATAAASVRHAFGNVSVEADEAVKEITPNALVGIAGEPTATIPEPKDRCIIPAGVSVVQFKADATNHEAVDHKKVHLATLRIFAARTQLGKFAISSIPSTREEDVIMHGPVGVTDDVVNAKVFCAMQEVKEGTSEELYKQTQAEFASVGCTHWEDYCNAAASHTFYQHTQRLGFYIASVVLRVFLFGFDGGPDCVGCIKRVHKRLQPFGHIMFAWVHCFFHRYHLCVKNLLTVLESQTYWGPGEGEFRTAYVSAVATIANVCKAFELYVKRLKCI